MKYFMHRTTIKNLALFFICNAIGLYVGPVIYQIGLIKMINIQSIGLTGDLATYHVGIVQLSWLACALFSFSFFFLKGKWRLAFLIAPIIVPALFTLAILLSYG